jgi:hypothetical protein
MDVVGALEQTPHWGYLEGVFPVYRVAKEVDPEARQ